MIHMEEIRQRKIYNEDYTPNLMKGCISKLENLCSDEVLSKYNSEVRDIRIQLENIERLVNSCKDKSGQRLLKKIVKQDSKFDKYYNELMEIVDLTFPKSVIVKGIKEACLVSYCETALDMSKLFEYYDLERDTVNKIVSVLELRLTIADLKFDIEEGDSLEYVKDILETKISLLNQDCFMYEDCREILTGAIAEYENPLWIGRVA